MPGKRRPLRRGRKTRRGAAYASESRHSCPAAKRIMPPDDRAQKAFALTTRTRTWYNETSNERDERSAPMSEDTRSILESIEDLRAEMNTGFLQLGSRLDSMGFRMEASRSEERRVGKECRSRWSPYH